MQPIVIFLKMFYQINDFFSGSKYIKMMPAHSSFFSVSEVGTMIFIDSAIFERYPSSPLGCLGTIPLVHQLIDFFPGASILQYNR